VPAERASLSARLDRQEYRIAGTNSETPKIYNYISESEFVVTASLVKTETIGKLKKKAELDLSDYLAAWIYTFKVEKNLFTRQTGPDLGPVDKKQLDEFRLISKGSIDDAYFKEDRYLFFLREIPADDPVFDGLDIDKTKKYYRVYSGAQGDSIFPGRSDPMHGKNPVGRIKLPNQTYGKLVEQIKTICAALSSGSKEMVLINLRNLADSTDDEILKENALFAISDLEKQTQTKEISNLISIIRDKTLLRTDPEKVIKAIDRLGELKAVAAVDDLADLLTLSRGEKYFDVENQPSGGIITPYSVYPAIKALAEIGEKSTKTLIKVIESNEASSLAAKNALDTLRAIYRDDLAKASDLLSEAARSSGNDEGTRRLLNAAEILRP